MDVSVFYSFVRPNNILLCAYRHQNLFSYSSADRHWACVYLLAIVKNALNIGVQCFVLKYDGVCYLLSKLFKLTPAWPVGK